MFADILQRHIFDLIQTLSILVGFYFTFRSFRDDTRSRRLEHLLDLNQQYIQGKQLIMEHPELSRVFKDKSKGGIASMTPLEINYIKQTIMHIYTVYMAMELKQLKPSVGIERDIRGFLSKPLPRKVWEDVRDLQDGDFVRYVDTVLDRD